VQRSTTERSAGTFSLGQDHIRAPNPLFARRHERNILREICSVRLESGEIDVAAVMRRIVRGEPQPPRLPRRVRYRPARAIHIWADANARMAPFAHDINRVSSLLQSTTNSTVSRNTWLYLDEVARGEVGASHVAPVAGLRSEERSTAPAAGPFGQNEVVLLLSELGAGLWNSEESWRLPSRAGIERFVERMQRLGVAPIALVPMGLERRGHPCSGVLPLVTWDRPTSPASVRKVLGAQRLRRGRPYSRDADSDGHLRLARACLFAARVTPRLLRALRTEMLPKSGPEYEAQVWFSAYLVPSTSEYAEIDHGLLADQAERVVSWTQLVAALREGEWEALGRHLAETSVLLDDSESVGQQIAIRPRDWADARATLSNALHRDAALFDLLTSGRRSAWFEELQSLCDGRGCLFLEQLWETTRLNSSNHALERFEESLLWAVYQDRLGDTDFARVKALLRNLVDALTNPIRLDEREAAVGWAATRLHRLPRVIHDLDEYQAASLAVDELQGIDSPRASLDMRWKPLIEGRALERYIRAPRRDVFLCLSGRKWILSLELPPKRASARLFRFRAPERNATHLYVFDDANSAGRPVQLAVGQQVELRASPVLEILTLSGDRYRFEAKPSSAPLGFGDWMREARIDQQRGDWVAVGRWSDRAASAGATELDKARAALRHAEAVAITEDGEQIQAALARMRDMAGKGLQSASAPQRYSVGARAAAALMRLLEIDGRIHDAIAWGERVLTTKPSLAGESKRSLCTLAHLVLVRAVMLDLRCKSLELASATAEAEALSDDLVQLVSGRRKHTLTHRAVAYCLSRLVEVYLVLGQIDSCRTALARIPALDGIHDSETEYE
jgi:hypothetical protein